MSSSPLHGLNIVDTTDLPQPHSQISDLSNTAAFPDLDAQLELWTNLAFQSDEPFVPRPLSPSDKPLDLTSLAHHPVESSTTADFDMSRLLSSFGIDPFTVLPSATSLLSSQDLPPFDPALLPPQLQHRPLSVNTSSFSPPPPNNLLGESAGSIHDAAPPAKRARTRKSSVATTSVTETPSSVEDITTPPSSSMTADADGPEATASSPTSPNTTTPISAAEDKRRRNTAASARFRAKKKEREAALEKRSKELEGRVGELERECEALRRENGWLKGLVVGVTNAGNNAQGTKRRRVEDGQDTDTELKDSTNA